MRATEQDGSYPRPMMCRERWLSLDGTWEFAHDDADAGLGGRWFEVDAQASFGDPVDDTAPDQLMEV